MSTSTSAAVPWKPAGYQLVVPNLSVVGAKAALDFYVKAFDGQLGHCMTDPSGEKVMHGEIRFGANTEGQAMVFVSDVMPEYGGVPSQVGLYLYVRDPDAAFKQAVDAGAKVKQPPADMFWGERSCRVEDAWGITWSLSKLIKEMSVEEMYAASQAYFGAMAEPSPATAPSASATDATEESEQKTEAESEQKTEAAPVMTSPRRKSARKDPPAPTEPRETRTRGKREKM